MSAAEQRAALAAIGSDLITLGGNMAERRRAALVHAQDNAPPRDFAELADAPQWLRAGRPDLERLAIRVALFAMGPALAASIDGDWLGDCAGLADEDAVDRAIEHAGRVPDGGLDPAAAADLPALGFDLLRAGLTPGLVRYLDWAPAAGMSPSRALVDFALAEALA